MQDTRDSSDGSGLLGFLPTTQFIKDLGVDVDGMWAVVATGASRVPILGEIAYDIIEGMRNSGYWKNDYYRILRTWSLFTAISALIIGPLVGFGAALVISFLLVMPVTVTLLNIAVVLGILLLPFAFINGLWLIFLSSVTWLLLTAAGVGMIVVGALMMAGVIDFAAAITLPLLFKWLTPFIGLGFRVLGFILILAGLGILALSGLALIGVLFGIILVIAPWIAVAGLVMVAAVVFLFAFLITLLMVGPIAMITIPLVMLPILLLAFAIFIAGFIMVGLTGNTNKGKQAEAVDQSQAERNAKNKSKDKKSKNDKSKDKAAKKGNKDKAQAPKKLARTRRSHPTSTFPTVKATTPWLPDPHKS